MQWIARQEALLGALANGAALRTAAMAARAYPGFAFPFRVAEAPALIPESIYAQDRAAMLALLRPLLQESFLAQARRAVPERFLAARPRRPMFFATDFARAFHDDGSLRHPTPELQSFPGNFFLWKAQLIPTLADMSAEGFPHARHAVDLEDAEALDALLMATILAGHDPALSAIIELDPSSQKTFVDAFLMARTLGMVLVDPRDLEIAGDGSLLARKWISAREHGPVEETGERLIRRAHVRCLPDELDAAGFDAHSLESIFRRPEELGRVSYSVHPEDFFLISKATLAGCPLDPPLFAADDRLFEVLNARGLALADGVLKPVDGAGGRGVMGVREPLQAADVLAVLVSAGSQPTHLWQQRYRSHQFSRMAMGRGGLDAGAVQQELRLMWVLPPEASEPVVAGSMVRWSEAGELASAGRAKALGTGTQTPVVAQDA
jgi:hypothetical protein